MHLLSSTNEKSNASDDSDGNPRRHAMPDQRISASLLGGLRLGIRPAEPCEGRPVHGDGGRAAVSRVGDGSLGVFHVHLDWFLKLKIKYR